MDMLRRDPGVAHRIEYEREQAGTGLPVRLNDHRTQWILGLQAFYHPFYQHRVDLALIDPDAVIITQGDKDFLVNNLTLDHGEALMELMAATHTGMSTEDFNQIVEEYLKVSRHPKYDRKYTELIYQPMLELLNYLRKNGFKTYISSGGGLNFMRVFSEATYGIGPENVIGSFAINQFAQVDGKWEIIKDKKNLFIHDGLTKPVGIDRHIGRIPIFVAGNVRSGGDIGQLSYSQTNTLPNFQLLINHDDEMREFAYSEKDNESLNAAEQNGWNVVSMKNDWKTIFLFDQ